MSLRVLAVLVDENIGLAGGKTFFAHLAADRLDAVEVGDRRLVVGRVVDAPSGAVRPIEPDALAHLAAQKLITGYTERLGLGVEERVLDRPHRLGDHAAGGRPGDA